MMDIITVNGSDRDRGAGEDVIYKFYKCCTAPGSLEYDENDPEKKFTGTGQILGTDLEYDPSTGTYTTGSDTPGATISSSSTSTISSLLLALRPKLLSNMPYASTVSPHSSTTSP